MVVLTGMRTKRPKLSMEIWNCHRRDAVADNSLRLSRTHGIEAVADQVEIAVVRY